MKVVFCSSAIIKNKNGEILLMSRKQKDSFINSWEFPGGKLKNNENFAVALFRELKEELNILIDISKLSNYCLLYTSPSPRDTDKSRMPSSA